MQDAAVVPQGRGPTRIHVSQTITEVDVDARVVIVFGSCPGVAFVQRGQHNTVATAGVHHDVKLVAASVLHEVGILAAAVLGAVVTAEVVDGHEVAPGLAAVQRTDVVVGIDLAVSSCLVEASDEDVDVIVVGTSAHHSREVRVVFAIHDVDRSKVAVRQVVLVFDDVDFAGAAAGVTRNHHDAVLSVAGGAAEASLVVFNQAFRGLPSIILGVVNGDVRATVGVILVGGNDVSHTHATIGEGHGPVLAGRVGLPVVGGEV